MSIQRKWKNKFWFGTQTSIAVFVLVAFCASLFPIPLPAPLNSSGQNREAYPCQHCACGCKSAEQCWRNCCCHSHQEKMEWAEEHNVTPPEYFLDLLEEEQVATGQFTERAVCVEPVVAQACCDSSPGKDKCSSAEIVCQTAKANGVQRPCCSDREQSCCGKSCKVAATKTAEATREAPTESGENGPGYVIRALALKCQGQSSALNLLPWMTHSRPQNLSCTEQPCSFSPPVSSHCHSRTLEPPVPPPKISSC